MKQLMQLFVALIALWLPGFVLAQSADDRGYLQAYLEDNLSDAGRQVRITGFTGALSARASIEQLTIADDAGIWLSLRDVVLDWDRAALLGGHLSISQLSVAEILLPRAPVSVADGLPSPEATNFALPDLPVAITIGSVNADRIVLGEALIGTPAIIALKGSALLAEGAGQADLTVSRTDGIEGTLGFASSYSNATTQLKLALELSETANGIAANLIGLPDRPAVDLTINGAGPLDDFSADIMLATDGVPRLGGQVSLLRALAQTDINETHRVLKADIGGDIAPVFAPQYRAFFGPDIRLKVTSALFDDGRVQVSDLLLVTKALTLQGQLAVAANGWPERFALKAEITDAGNAAVLLPLPGDETRIAKAHLNLSYDRAQGDAWHAEGVINTLERRALTIANMRLGGVGTLLQGDDTTLGKVLGQATYAANGITLADADLMTAIGAALSGEVHFEWTEAAPLKLSSLIVNGEDYGLTGAAQLKGLNDGLNLSADGAVTLKADNLVRFSGVSGLALEGAAALKAKGVVSPINGAFALTVTGSGVDLGIGQPQLDPLLVGNSLLNLNATRDETGTEINRFEITTDHLQAQTSGRLSTGASVLTLEAQIVETARVATGLTGPASLAGTLQQTGPNWAVDLSATGPGGLTAVLKAVAGVEGQQLGRITGQLTAGAKSLTPFSGLAGRPLSGAATLATDGWFDPTDMTFEASLDAKTQSLGFGVPMLDPLLRGAGEMTANLRRGDGGDIGIDHLELVTPQGRAVVTGTAQENSSTLRFVASLRDLGLLAPGLTGPAQAEGTATLNGRDWQISASGTGAGGTVARVSGQLAANGTQANLAMIGTAPLALANSYITPNLVSGQANYDLTLKGPLALSSLVGSINIQAGRLVVPNQRLSFDPISASVRIADGRAILEAKSPVSSGGQLSLSGPVALSHPFEADLNMQLSGVGVSDATYFDTTLNGQVTMRGPLASGARIAADLSLGVTEVRVAESGADTAPVLANLEHLNEPAAVRQTRARAGLLADGNSKSGPQIIYPIDILLNAPARIFVRGRGLDAELGGQLRLTGTTADVVPQGQFDLIRGRLDILGKRLTLAEGNVRLRGGFDPFLYLVAQTQSADTDIRIVIEGLASAPQITFSSSPDLPEDEVLARLLFGRDLSKISPLQAVQLAAAVRTLAGGGSGLLDKLRTKFGLDDLDITTDETGAAGAKVGKYIGENLYTDVTVGSDGSSEINLNLTISPSVTGRGTVKSSGESSLGIFVERDY